MPDGLATAHAGLDAHVAPSKWPGILIVSFAALGGILFGYDTGTISGVKEMPSWLCDFGHPIPGTSPTQCAVSSATEGVVVSILSLGTFLGALAGGPMADIVGRKSALVFSCLIFSIGVAMQTVAQTIALFVVGRVFAGLGVGLVSMLVPMYQSECAPKRIRGAVVSGYQCAITIGLLVAAVINNATKDRPGPSAYRIPIALQLIWAAILAGGMLLLPESPRWLVRKGLYDAAARSMSRLTGLPAGHPVIQRELDEVRANLSTELPSEGGFTDCFRASPNRIRLRTFTGIALQACSQLTGVNFIVYYGPTFFIASGLRDPFLIQIVVTVVNTVCTFPGMYGVERLGRRPLLIAGALGMAACQYLVAALGMTLSTRDEAGQIALIVLVCMEIACFAGTWGPVSWVLTGELFPLGVRARAVSLSAASNWLFNFAIGYATPYLVNKEPGSAGLESRVFFIWGTACLGAAAFTYVCIPETAGLSLEQVDVMYQKTTPMRSVAWRQQQTLWEAHTLDKLEHDRHAFSEPSGVHNPVTAIL